MDQQSGLMNICVVGQVSGNCLYVNIALTVERHLCYEFAKLFLCFR